MLEYGMTIREAAERWVQGFNAFPHDMIEKLMAAEPDTWHEVTTPSEGRRVYVFNHPAGCKSKENWGEITGYDEEEDVYTVELDDGTEIQVGEEHFEMETDGGLPMWGTLWAFADSCDDWWLEEQDGIRIISECGFRVFKSDDFGYFFGIDGAGYSFYEAHWVPLYRARGLQWHDPATDPPTEPESSGAVGATEK